MLNASGTTFQVQIPTIQPALLIRQSTVVMQLCRNSNNGGKPEGTANALEAATNTSTDVYNWVTTGVPTSPSNVPKAYVNWISFNEQFVPVSSNCGYDLVSTSPDVVKPHSDAVNIGASGYLYVNCSNESNVDAYFDNLQVIQTKGPLLETNSYYPLGLTMAGISDKAVKTNYAENKYRYNGKELQHQEFADGTGLEVYDYGARMQDPQLGMWHNIDSHADKYQSKSAYVYAFDNPLVFVDPNGMNNVIYLYAADNSVRKKQLNAIAKQANANFLSMGLKTQVKLFKGTFNSERYKKLQTTDAVAVIGNAANVEKSISGYNPKFANELKDGLFGIVHTDEGTNPEHSQNPGSSATPSEGNIIALGTEATKASAKDTKELFENYAASDINHDAGHNSGFNHAYSPNGYNIFVPDAPNIMVSGNMISQPLQYYVNSPINQQPAGQNDRGSNTVSIKDAYIKRFGNNTPKASLPTTPLQ